MPFALQPIAQWTAIFGPAVYTGITLTHSTTLSLLATSPVLSPPTEEKLLAKQWHLIYRQGPNWVPPIINSAALSNVYLWYNHSQTRLQGGLYLLSAGILWGVLAVTFYYFETGINGACKWRLARLLKDGEGTGKIVIKGMKKGWIIPSVNGHTASEGSKKWGEETGMRELVMGWVRRNQWRWIAVGVAGGISGWASLGRFS
ncbi:hypothetical protein QC763_123480 [Podospora pseudopauciseta]|uniref:Uncharacterized protein n=2 Tax=Podospora TaxID=5144 RepID=A0ABR0I303_9PEZI|nr:hypothetical protein QC763_123480 [Podospora pseudopauciseta]KAK4683257.1 hypothetical protein QC764_123480 [Podospora pseudoanserina]